MKQSDRSSIRPRTWKRRPGETRARTDEAKDKVRSDLIEAGRRLFATEEYSAISLRRIAKEAHRTPGTVYQYFPDRRALFFAIRELDLEKVADMMEEISRRFDDPLGRIRALVDFSLDYWTKNIGTYGLRYISELIEPSSDPAVGASYIETSPSSSRIHAMWDLAVRGYFAEFEGAPEPPAVATDALMAATQGVLALPASTPFRTFSTARDLANELIDGLLLSWREKYEGPAAKVATKTRSRRTKISQ